MVLGPPSMPPLQARQAQGLLPTPYRLPHPRGIREIGGCEILSQRVELFRCLTATVDTEPTLGAGGSPLAECTGMVPQGKTSVKVADRRCMGPHNVRTFGQ